MYFWSKGVTPTKRIGQNMCLNEETERKKLCRHDKQRGFFPASCMDIIQCISSSHHHGCSREIPFIKIFVKEMKMLFLSCVTNLSRRIL